MPNDAGAVPHQDLANALRALSMDAVEEASSGLPGMPMGMADIAVVLFSNHLRFDPTSPRWPDRDRFVLSNGHGSMLLYSLLHLTGYEDMTLEQIKRFRQLGSITAGHPEYGHAAGIETTTGPLGQGLANGVGMALAERILNARFGGDLVDHHTYVFAGDGCLMEGISHEAIGLAGHLKLSKLIVLFDDNHISIDGPTQLATSEDAVKRFEAQGWDARRVDGHDPAAVHRAIEEAKGTDRPSLIACRTTIGYGAPTKAGTAEVHGSALGPEERDAAKKNLGWAYGPFEVPEPIRAAWMAIGARGKATRQAWEARLAATDAATREEFLRGQAGTLPSGLDAAVQAKVEALLKDAPSIATRKSSQIALELLTAEVPELVGGSADLTPSNNTKVGATEDVTPGDYGGRYVRYGVREHGMAAAMNGIAVHGGLIPYGGTFLVFTDYARPSIRLSSLMHARVIYVMTHDSIGLGEDGPTHQPVEQVMALRAIPGIHVFRPADAVETLECWRLALSLSGPSILALTRQGLPAIRKAGDGLDPSVRYSEKGAYVVREPEGGRQVTLLATGSEVSLAVAAADQLAESGTRAAVVSMPCWELFEAQDDAYRAAVLGDAPRVSVEAGTTFGWERYTGPGGRSVGMTTFGASGKGKEVMAHFGFTPDNVAEAARAALRR
ncbi:MAG: transketolase [Sandaracinaceae bacterium]